LQAEENRGAIRPGFAIAIMRLRYQYLALAKIFCIMLPSFLNSCHSAKEIHLPSVPPLATDGDYVFIPKTRLWFDVYDEGQWRFITQGTDYIDGSHLNSLSSIWVYQFMPLEIVVLDNPQVAMQARFAFSQGDGLMFKKTTVFLPFNEAVVTDDFDGLLPICNENEFRAIVRIISPLKYIGILNNEIMNATNQNVLHSWFSLGNVVCLKVVKK
jgi:hypothetical protein